MATPATDLHHRIEGPPDRPVRALSHAMRASVADAVIGRWFTPSFAERRPDTVAAIRAIFESTPAEGYAATCEALAQMDQRPDLPRIVAPTLVIAAEHDQSTPPEQSREMVT